MARRLVVAVAGVACAVGLGLAWAPRAEAGEAPKPRDPYAIELPRGVQVFHWSVDFSGDMRLRGEHWDDADFNRHADDTDGLFQLRTRLRTDLRFAETARAVVELLDAREWQSDRSPRPQQNELDIHQAYVQLDQLLGVPLVLRLGRQEIDLGATRLVSAPTWQNNIRSFDAARLSYADDAVEVHGFGGSVVVAEENHLDRNRHGEAFFGVYSTLKTFGAHKLDLYALGLVSRNKHFHVTGEDGAKGNHERYTVGARLYGNLAERWTYDTEMAVQRGHYAHDRIRAWAIHADTAYTLNLPWQPTLQAVFNLASGDKNPTDSRRNTFDPLFGSCHGPYGIIDFFHWMNMREIGAVLKVNPIRKLTISAEAHRYWLDEGKDAWYTTGKRARRRDATGRSGNTVGHELSLVLKYALDRQVTLEGGIARFYAGPFVHDTGPSDDADFAYLQTLIRF